ncbi:CvpA family protein [Candidatus Uhrbacteria bacterium]|nr:CvpA family protein [Candidatus Uhrbacteria bacterium]
MALGSLPVIDIILLFFVAAFVMIGFWFGFVHMIGSVIGLFGGVLVAGFYYEPFAGFLAGLLGCELNAAKVVAFFLLLILVNRAFGLLFWIVDRIFRITSFIPFVKMFDRLLGAVLGLLEGVIVIGLLVFVSAHLPMGEAVALAMESSRLIHPLGFFGGILAPLLPQAMGAVQPILN